MFLLRSCILLTVCYRLVVSAKVDFDTTSINHGKTKLDSLKSWSQLPNYGSCWTRAVDQLSEGCRQLSEETQSRLAIALADCFLRMTGRSMPPCEGNDLSVCLSSLDERQFSSYREFFTHTQNMCSFLQAQVWQQATVDTIDQLSTGAAAMAAQLKLSGSVQTDILEAQRQALDNQHQLAENGRQMSLQVDAWQDSVAHVINDFRERTAEHHHLILGVFEQLASLQQLVLDRLSWFNSLVHYTVGVLLAYLATATSRTANARIWLFVCLSVNLFLERCVTGYLVVAEQNSSAQDTDALLQLYIWLLRRCCVAICLLILVTAIYNYRDLNSVNFKLLQQLHQQHVQLHQQLSALGLLRKPVMNDQLKPVKSMTSSDRSGLGICPLTSAGDTVDSLCLSTLDSQLELTSANSCLSLEADISSYRCSIDSPHQSSRSREHSPLLHPQLPCSPLSNSLLEDSWRERSLSREHTHSSQVSNGSHYNLRSRRSVGSAETATPPPEKLCQAISLLSRANSGQRQQLRRSTPRRK